MYLMKYMDEFDVKDIVNYNDNGMYTNYAPHLEAAFKYNIMNRFEDEESE